MEKKHQTLKELPISERPYEKCEKSGVEALSDAELMWNERSDSGGSF